MRKNASSMDLIYKPGANYKVTTPGQKFAKREKVFSKSHDTREDRGTRQMKTARNVSSFPHVR